MKRIRALLLLSFAALGGIAPLVSRSDAAPGTVRIVVPGVWFLEGDKRQGHCNNADIGNWPAVLRAAEKLKVKYVLPGHGLPGGRDGWARLY
jgi:hypothetical protein